MPPEYIEQLYQSRVEAATDPQQVLQRLMRVLLRTYSTMIAEIQRDVAGGTPGEPITSARAAGLRQSIEQHLSRFANEFGGAVDREIRDMIQDVRGAHIDATQASFQRANVQGAAQVVQRFDDVPEQTLRLMMVRRDLGLATTFRSLAAFRAQLSMDELNDLIVSNVGRGVSSQRTARQIASLLAGKDTQVRELINQNRTGSLLDFDEAVDDAGPAMKEAKRLYRIGETIAVTETNTAHFEASRLSASRSPVIKALRWRLSGRHAGLRSSPDECDYLSQADLYGLGAGIYPPEKIPAQPHPRCQCTFVYVTRPPEKWRQPRPTPERTGAVTEEEIRGVIEGRGGSIGDQGLSTVTDRIREYVELAEEAGARAA
jgi:hypothetical protein